MYGAAGRVFGEHAVDAERCLDCHADDWVENRIKRATAYYTLAPGRGCPSIVPSEVASVLSGGCALRSKMSNYSGDAAATIEVLEGDRLSTILCVKSIYYATNHNSIHDQFIH